MPDLPIMMIGCGAVARVHAMAIEKHGDARLAAVVGPDLSQTQAFSSEHGGCAAFDNLDQALQATHARAAIIATPSKLHAAQAQQAIDVRLHTLVEFPLSAPNDVVRGLFDHAADNKRILAVAHTNRFKWVNRRIKKLLDSGQLGRCNLVSILRQIDRPQNIELGPRPRTWHDDVLQHHAAHLLDLCRYWFGDHVELIDAVSPMAAYGRRNCSLLLRGPRAIPISISASYDAARDHFAITLAMEHGTLEIINDTSLRVNGIEDTTDRPQSERAQYHQAIARQDAAFFDACLGRNSFDVTPAVSIALAALSNQALRSADRVLAES